MKNVKTLRCVFNWQPNVFLWEICWHIAFLFMLVFFLSVHSIHKSMLGCCFRFIISGNWNGKGSKSWNVNMKNVNVIPPISETPAIASYFSFHEFIIRMKHFHFISFLFFLVDHFFYSTLCFVHIHFSFFLSQNSIWFKIHCKIECESSKKKTHECIRTHAEFIHKRKKSKKKKRLQINDVELNAWCVWNFLWYTILNVAFRTRLFSTEEELTDIHIVRICFRS